MEGAINFVKAHPFLTGGSVIVIILVAVVFSGGSGDAAQASPQPDDPNAMAGIQLQALQYQAAIEGGKTAAQLQLGMEAQATERQRLTLDAQTAQNANTLAAQVAEQGFSLKQFESTLAADLEGKRIAADTAENASQHATLLAQATLARESTQDILDTNVQMAKIAAQPRGLLSWLFG